MPNSAASRSRHRRSSEAVALLNELHETNDSLALCLGELEKVLSQPGLDAGALTSVRLKLAGIRLTRGPLITKVADFLNGKVTDAEAARLDELRTSHHRLLQIATMHTAKWTLEAIARDWSRYRQETRELVRQWMAKAQREQRFVYPLVERCAG